MSDDKTQVWSDVEAEVEAEPSVMDYDRHHPRKKVSKKRDRQDPASPCSLGDQPSITWSPREQTSDSVRSVSKKSKAPRPSGGRGVVSKKRQGAKNRLDGGSTASPSMYWCVTDNQPGRIDHDLVLQDQSYKVYQLEEGDEGHEHYQLYVEFAKKKRFKAVQKLFQYPDGGYCHIEKRRGTRQEAREYCMKQESRIEGPWEFGDWTGPKAGQRNDLDQIRDLFKDGKSLEEIAELFPSQYVRYTKGLQSLARLYGAPVSKSKPRNIYSMVVVGPPGVGKDLMITLMTDKKACVMNFRAGAEWYDAYTRQPALHVQEYNGQLPWESLLLLLDPSDQHVPIKGAMVKAEWQQAYFSSNVHPYEWYPDAKHQAVLEALIRRISCLMIYDAKNGDFKEDMKHREARNRIFKRSGLPVDVSPPAYVKPDVPKWLDKLGLKRLDEVAVKHLLFNKLL